MMTWDQIKDSWDQVSGQVMKKWGKLSEMELSTIAGRREMLIKSLLSHYDWGHATTEKYVDDFAHGLDMNSFHRNPTTQLLD